MDNVSEFHAEAPQATVSEGLAKGSYVAVRARFELMTLRTKGVKSTNEPPRPQGRLPSKNAKTLLEYNTTIANSK